MLAKKFRLTKNGSFSYVYRKGRAQPSRLVSLTFVLAKGNLRVGFSVPNKVGKAVVRNKLKRRLRYIIEGLLPRIAPSQIVISAKSGADTLSYDSLKALVIDLLTRAQLLSGIDVLGTAEK